jgi:REP element-mobilizing transposase RayT
VVDRCGEARREQSRLEELADCFVVTVGGFAVMNNHLHVLVGLDPEIATSWSGRSFAASQAKLRETAEHVNVRYVVNLTRYPAR